MILKKILGKQWRMQEKYRDINNKLFIKLLTTNKIRN